VLCCEEVPVVDVEVADVVASDAIAVAVPSEGVGSESALECPFAVGVALGVAVEALAR
jgi:hypothetical protein